MTLWPVAVFVTPLKQRWGGGTCRASPVSDGGPTPGFGSARACGFGPGPVMHPGATALPLSDLVKHMDSVFNSELKPLRKMGVTPAAPPAQIGRTSSVLPGGCFLP